MLCIFVFFFFQSKRRHTICSRDWSSDVCSSDLAPATPRHEDHFGHKIEWENDVLMRFGSAAAGSLFEIRCDVLAKLHQGTHSRSEEHTSELQSRLHLVCRLLLEKKKKKTRHSARAKQRPP